MLISDVVEEMVKARWPIEYAETEGMPIDDNPVVTIAYWAWEFNNRRVYFRGHSMMIGAVNDFSYLSLGILQYADPDLMVKLEKFFGPPK